MKSEYDLAKMTSRRTPHASELQKWVTIRLSENVIEPGDRSLAQDFYNFCGYGGDAIAPSDRVVLAWRQDEIVGIGRLCHEDGFLCLRGVQIHPDFRRVGIGTQVLAQLERAIGGNPCYCLPYGHLIDFYGQAGFVQTDAELPPVLQARLASNRQRGLDVIAMFQPDASQWSLDPDQLSPSDASHMVDTSMQGPLSFVSPRK